jgi:hypothetical protein
VPHQNQPRSYTLAVLKRIGLLSIGVSAVALLGASIVFAQQGTPGGEGPRTVPPQATPIVQVPDRPDVWIPTQPIYKPYSPPETNPQLPVNPNLPIASNQNVLIANIPPELMPVPEMKAVAQPGVASSVAMAAVGPDLKPIPEAPALPGPMPASMTVDPRSMPVPEVKPLLQFGAPATAAVQLNAAPPHLMPIPEKR